MTTVADIQYVCDADGNSVSVIVPIELWREIESERETAYLLKSSSMRQRLLEARNRDEGIPFTRPARSLEFDPKAFEDLAWWVERDRKRALRVLRLIREIQRQPFHGTGKPEPLKHELVGCWSRRIDSEHRLVYQVSDRRIRILACRYHY